MGIRLGLAFAQGLGHGILDTFGKDNVLFIHTVLEALGIQLKFTLCTLESNTGKM